MFYYLGIWQCQQGSLRTPISTLIYYMIYHNEIHGCWKGCVSSQMNSRPRHVSCDCEVCEALGSRGADGRGRLGG